MEEELGELKNCLSYLEHEIDGKDYFLGEFSLADISVGYMLFLLKLTRFDGGLGDPLEAYFSRIRQREAWVLATAR